MFDFKLACTTPQHYLDIYIYKNNLQQKRKLYEIILDLHLLTGKIHLYHPLKIVQQICDSFRGTAVMEKDTAYELNDLKIKEMIVKNQ